MGGDTYGGVITRGRPFRLRGLCEYPLGKIEFASQCRQGVIEQGRPLPYDFVRFDGQGLYGTTSFSLLSQGDMDLG